MISQKILGICLLIIGFGVSGCVSTTVIDEEIKTELSQAIESLSFHRGVTEIKVAIAQAQYSHNPALLNKLRILYGTAENRANSFIDRLKMRLTLRSKIDANEIEEGVKRVVDAVNELDRFADPPFVGTEGEITASAIIGLIPPAFTKVIVGEVLKILEKAKDREDKFIEELKKELDRHRWKSLAELGAVAGIFTTIHG